MIRNTTVEMHCTLDTTLPSKGLTVALKRETKTEKLVTLYHGSGQVALTAESWALVYDAVVELFGQKL